MSPRLRLVLLALACMASGAALWAGIGRWRSPPRTTRAVRLVDPSETALGPGLWSGQAYARADGAPGPGTLVLWARFDPSRASLRYVETTPAAPRLADHRPPGPHALVNGGYFEQDSSPSGLIIGPGLSHPRSGGRKTGAFAVAKGRSFVGRLAEVPSGAAFVIEAWPRLVEGGMPIKRREGPRARRTAACQLPDGQAIFAAVAPDQAFGGLSLAELATLLAEPPPGGLGCVAAVNLDGGPSTAFYARGPGIERAFAERAPIAYGVLICPDASPP